MKAYLLVVLATLLWATNIALGRSLHDQIGPFTLSAARFTVAGLVFLIFMLHARTTSKNTHLSISPSNSSIPRQKAFLLTAAMGVTGVFAFTTVLYLALHWTTASNASLINAVGPLITMIMASLFLSEALSSRSITGAVISLAGVVLIITQASIKNILSLQFNLGDLLALAAVFLWSVYSLLARRATRTLSAFTVTAFSTWIALPLLYPASFMELQAAPRMPGWNVVLAVIYIGIFPSFLAFYAWNEGVRRLGPGRAMAFYNLLPVFGVLLGVLFLGEALSWSHIAGGVMVILGGVLAAVQKLPKTSTG